MHDTDNPKIAAKMKLMSESAKRMRDRREDLVEETETVISSRIAEARIERVQSVEQFLHDD